jgi:hypothetical protein
MVDEANERQPDGAGALRRDSDELLRAIDDLKAIEQRKREVPVSTPEFHDYADQANAASRRIFEVNDEQFELGEELEEGTPPINDLAG